MTTLTVNTRAEAQLLVWNINANSYWPLG